jgi:hypothetical protein
MVNPIFFYNIFTARKWFSPYKLFKTWVSDYPCEGVNNLSSPVFAHRGLFLPISVVLYSVNACSRVTAVGVTLKFMVFLNTETKLQI